MWLAGGGFGILQAFIAPPEIVSANMRPHFKPHVANGPRGSGSSHRGLLMIVWITSANTSNAKMRQVLEASFAAALRLLNAGERYVQIKATE
jgi:hypothetical protein